jgi:hypothetical protein
VYGALNAPCASARILPRGRALTRAGLFPGTARAEVRQMEVMSQLQAKLRRAQFRIAHPVSMTEQHADPVELVFQAFLRLDREQRARLVQRLK